MSELFIDVKGTDMTKKIGKLKYCPNCGNLQVDFSED